MYMKKILFYPGTFNPPHLGHASAVEVALKNIDFDEVWIMPSGRRVDKVIPTKYEDRINLTNLFIEHLQTLTDAPIKLVGYDPRGDDGKYTHEIIQDIKNECTDEMYQLVGIDGFLGIKERIIGPEEKFVVIKRSGFQSANELPESENIIILDEDVSGISSTKIREMVKQGHSGYKSLVPKKISDYIESNSLYLG